MKTTTRIAAACFAFILLAFVLQMKVVAQDTSANPSDPPSRVARLSYLAGSVSFQPGGVDDWVTATLNRPLTTSDRLWTDRGARAELQTGAATLRLDGDTSFTLANLDDNRAQIQIAAGVLNVKLRQLDPRETFEIDTPNFTLNLLRAGEYRIQVDSDNDVSWVTVRSGSAEVTGGPQAVTLQPGQQARFAGTSGGSYDLHAAPGPDGFDQWCVARDRREDSARSAQYVSRDVIGYEDLDDYGTWRNYDGYGQVWVPRVTVVDWAPYRYGHWAWVYPWGWTWVDDAPWGFAPFHYGRWVHAGFGWGWVPGPIYVRPVYAPALVAWCGGGGWGVSLSFGSGVGWFPLGPREPYIPWYWGSRHYFSRVNITNTHIVNVNNYYNNYYYPHWRDHDGRHDRGDHDRDFRPGRDDNRTIAHIDYANRHAPNGMTYVDHDSFVRGRDVSRVAMRVPQDKLRNAPVVYDNGFKPDRGSLLGGRVDSSKVHPPNQVFDRPFVSKAVPPKPLPFESQANKWSGHGAPGRDNGQARVSADVNGRPESHMKRGPVIGATGNEVSGDQSRSITPDSRRYVPRPGTGLTNGIASRTGDAGTRHVDFGPSTGRVVTSPTGNQPAHVDIGPHNGNQSIGATEARVERPHWNVPKPPAGHVAVDTSVREYRTGNGSGMSNGNQGGGSTVHNNNEQWGGNGSRVHVDRGRTSTPPAVYNPPQENRTVRTVEQPRARVEGPQSAPRYEAPQRTERVFNSNAGRTEHNAQQGGGGHSGGGYSGGGHSGEGHTQSGGNSGNQGRRSQ